MSTLTIAAGGAVHMPARAVDVASGALRAPGSVARPATAVRVGNPTVRRPVHLTRRGRLVVLLLALGAAVAGTFAASDAAASGPQSAPVVERYLVAPGDTLWRIAEGLASPGEDVRDVVRELVLLNKLPSAGLTAGQEIVLPADR